MVFCTLTVIVALGRAAVLIVLATWAI